MPGNAGSIPCSGSFTLDSTAKAVIMIEVHKVSFSHKEFTMTLIACPKTVYGAAKVLDRKIKGWYNKINIDTLCMGSTSTCILGQLFNGQCETQDIFDCNLNGFTSSGNNRGYGGSNPFFLNSPFGPNCKSGLMRTMWIAQIEKRKARNAKLKAKRAAAKPMPEQLIVELNPAIYAEAGKYTDIGACPIATAVKKLYPQYRISVGPTRVSFYNLDAKPENCVVARYEISGSTGDCTFIAAARLNNWIVPIVLKKRDNDWKGY